MGQKKCKVGRVFHLPKKGFYTGDKKEREEGTKRGGTGKKIGENEREEQKGKKACFFPLKGGKRKNSAAIFFFFSTKNQKIKQRVSMIFYLKLF